MQKIENLIILGSGPAGLTAAIYAARANFKPLLFTGQQVGGQLTTTTLVENYPGFENGIYGPDLMQNMIKQAENFGTRFIYESIVNVDFKNSKIKKLISESGKEYFAKSVIIATGASPKWLGLESEKKFKGLGVSSCATCDGAFFKDKIVAVIGGGDTAMEEALFLTRFASKVYIIHRRDAFRASKFMQDKVFNNTKIEIIWNHIVEDIQGNDKVEKIIIKNIIDNQINTLKVDGIFVAIGHDPNTKFLQDQIELDEKGYIKTFDIHQTHTNIEGVFVAGDAFDFTYRQAITAAGSGCKAALEAEKYLTMAYNELN